MTLVVGLTGGIGSGKSTVCRLFAQRGAVVIDADEIAAELVAPGEPALASIVREFGEHIVDAEGKLRRDRLRSIVFSDPESRKRLERLLHPRILQEMQYRARAVEAPYCLLCIPLLAETGQSGLVGRVLVVDSPVDLQVRRVTARDHLTVDDVEAIIRVQASRATRLQAADDVIVNDADIGKLERQVGALHQAYLKGC